MQRKSIAGGFAWVFLTKVGNQGIQFVISIILARLLDPQHYGTLALMTIFISLANVFIQNGFSTALIQNKDVTEKDYSTVFWIMLLIAGCAYAILFAAAPVIAAFYAMPQFVAPFRVLTLVLFTGAFNAVQSSRLSREMDFKKVFYCNLGASLAAGTLGILAAFAGWGVWALVIQMMTNSVISCTIMWLQVKWRPEIVFDYSRMCELFSYGSKILVAGVIDNVYNNLKGLIIGKKYDGSMLAYYNRGQQTPQMLMDLVNGSVQTVLLPALSAQQDDKARMKSMMSQSISLSTFVVFPMMAGMIAVSEPLVRFLLTDKWLPCVPYMRIICLELAFHPMLFSTVQAINAAGRSDVSLKLEMIKKAIAFVILCIAVFGFSSPIAIAMTGVYMAVVSCVVNTRASKRIVGYSMKEMLRDTLPAAFVSAVMCLLVLGITSLPLSDLPMLVVQVVVGVACYAGLAAALKLKPLMLCVSLLKRMIEEKRGKAA